jgi:hypothetical protein
MGEGRAAAEVARALTERLAGAFRRFAELRKEQYGGSGAGLREVATGAESAAGRTLAAAARSEFGAGAGTSVHGAEVSVVHGAEESVVHGADAPAVHGVGSSATRPLVFDSPTAARAYGERVWGSTIDRLGSGDRELLHDYTAGRSTPINDMLRDDRLRPIVHTLTSVAEPIGRLDEILARKPVSEWVRVAKTIQSGRLFPDLDIAEVPIGHRGTFRDFVSTSLHPDGTAALRDLERRDTDALIDVAPGTPALYLGSVSATADEVELLLGRDLDFELTAKQRVGDRWSVALRLLGEGA